MVKAILDKLELPHIIDGISLHNTSADLSRMKTLHNTEVWNFEQDGSLSFLNQFGNNGHLEYRKLSIGSISEFRFVDLYSLRGYEGEFLADLLCKFEFPSKKLIINEKQKAAIL